MEVQDAQKRIDAITWYHEFDFGNGLQAKSAMWESDDHRAVWAFLRKELDKIDFRGKTVLDIGCLDGYWSFYAESRGAAQVLAIDDVSQNWVGKTGVHLAKELLGSKIDIDLGLSVYDLTKLGRTFDIILYLGVYYHLHSPFQAFAQIRHCCHERTMVAMDGPVTHGIPEGSALYNFADHSCEWLPTPGAVKELTAASYFDVEEYQLMSPAEAVTAPPPEGGKLGWRYRMKLLRDALSGSRKRILDRAAPLAPPVRPPRQLVNRAFARLRPNEAACPAHIYPPPFGLGAYDPRFRAAA